MQDGALLQGHLQVGICLETIGISTSSCIICALWDYTGQVLAEKVLVENCRLKTVGARLLDQRDIHQLAVTEKEVLVLTSAAAAEAHAASSAPQTCAQ